MWLTGYKVKFQDKIIFVHYVSSNWNEEGWLYDILYCTCILLYQVILCIEYCTLYSYYICSLFFTPLCYSMRTRTRCTHTVHLVLVVVMSNGLLISLVFSFATVVTGVVTTFKSLEFFPPILLNRSAPAPSAWMGRVCQHQSSAKMFSGFEVRALAESLNVTWVTREASLFVFLFVLNDLSVFGPSSVPAALSLTCQH